MIQRRVNEPTQQAPTGVTLDALYSPITVDHIAHPRNLGVIENASGVGIVDDAETENYLAFYVQVDRAEITRATFRALACSACFAASSVLTEVLTGLRIARALRIGEIDVLAAMGGLPESKHHCARLAAQAAHLALVQAQERAPA
jgi:nitrogen fixation NifU-like protein